MEQDVTLLLDKIMIRRHFLMNQNKYTGSVIKYTTSDGSLFDLQGILDFWASFNTEIQLGAYVTSNTYNDVGQIVLNTIIDRTSFSEVTQMLFPIFTTSILSEEDIFNISKLTSVELPDTIKYIGTLTFQLCTGLQHVTLEEGLISIGEGAFNSCVSLQNINIPDSTVSIEKNAFVNCSSLYEVTLGCNLNKIDDGAFDSCSALPSIVFPNSLTYIGQHAFIGCTSLNDIYYSGTISEWDNVEKQASWNEGVPATVVHCTDGDVEI